MNAPSFLRRNQAAVKREPLLHPVDLDHQASTVQLFAGKLRPQRTEAEAVGDIAEQAVIRATQLTREVDAMIDKAKAIANDIERDGLALIAAVQKQQEEFNARTENFVRSATELHTGLRDVLSKVGKPREQEPPAELPAETAATIETGLADMVQTHAAQGN